MLANQKEKMNNEKVDKKELDRMLFDAIEMVRQLGYESQYHIKEKVRVYPATSYYGQCRRREDDLGNIYFEITISEYHLANGYKMVMNTLIHEVMHTIKGCFNHGKKWQKIANQVKNAYGIDIQTTGRNKPPLPKKKRKAEKPKYIVTCSNSNCELEILRKRKSNIIKYPENYRCGICGSRIIASEIVDELKDLF